MELGHITFKGTPYVASAEVERLLPQNLISLLKQLNGFVQYGGGLHVRGVCEEPGWHSLISVMSGPQALHRLYPSVLESDVPFAQDCMADQYILRSGVVHKLHAEVGDVESLGVGLGAFFESAGSNPVEFLGMEPLLQLQRDGSCLQPGEVIHAYPPFCTKEAANGVSLKAVRIDEALRFLADFSSQVAKIEDGGSFQVKIIP